MNNSIHDYLKALDPRNFFHGVYKDRVLVVKYFNRAERVDLLEKRLGLLQQSFDNTLEYIKFILDEVLKPLSRCDFVIFQIGTREDQFIQFWIRDKKLLFDFPLAPGNDHLGFMKHARALFEKLGFEYKEILLQPMQYTYKIDDPKDNIDMSTLQADFGRHTDIAAQYVVEIFTDVFKKDVKKVTFQLGTQENKLDRNVKIGKTLLGYTYSRLKSRLK